MGRKRRKSYECPNCQQRLKDHINYCPNCGQENHQVVVGVKHLLRDFLQDYLTFDAKIIRSLKPLLFSPGKLTLEYSKGKRMQYIPPIRLYIFISFLFFFVSSLDWFGNEGNTLDPIETKEQITNSDSTNASAEIDGVNFNLTESGKKIKAINDGVARFNQLDEKQRYSAISKGISYMMFFLLPIYALLLMLIFIKSNKFYVEHLVFSFHIHGFYFLVFLMLTFIEWIYDSGWISFFAFLGMGFYTYKAIRNVYQLVRWKAILQFFLLSTLHAVLIFIGVLTAFLSVVINL